MPRSGGGVPRRANGTGTTPESGSDQNTETEGAEQAKPSALSSSRSFAVYEGNRFMAPIGSIAPNPRNPREEWEFETEEFEEFREHLNTAGAVQDPVVCSVRAFTNKYKDQNYRFDEEVEWVLLAGERRWRAHKANGLTETPAVRRDQLLEMGDLVFLAENQYRKPLSPLQECEILFRENTDGKLSYTEIAQKLGDGPGRSKTTISKKVRVYRDSTGSVREAFTKGELDLDSAYNLLRAFPNEPEKVEEACVLMLADALKDSEAIAAVRGESAQETPAKASPPPNPVTPTVAPAGETLMKEPKPAAAAVPTPAEPLTQRPQASAADAADAAEPTKLPAPAVPAPRPSAAKDEPERAARVAACGVLLGTTQYTAPGDERTIRFARTLAALADFTIADVVREFGQHDAWPDAPGSAAFKKFAAGDAAGAELLRAADAVTIAVGEIHLRHALAGLESDRTAAASLLDRLAREAGYEPTEQEQALLVDAVSSAKH